jgi:serine/threonine-protein kinase
MAAARMLRPPRELAEVAPHCPPALVDIVQRALSRSPDVRFAMADEMRTALSSISFDRVSPPSERPPPRTAPRERRIAVLPFRAAQSEDAWIADGLAGDLVDSLSLVRGVRVRARPGPIGEGEDVSAYGRRLDDGPSGSMDFGRILSAGL